MNGETLARRRAAQAGDQLRKAAKPRKMSSEALADMSVDPMVSAAATIQCFSKGSLGELPLEEAYSSVGELVISSLKGDLATAEATLVSQAASLNSIFTELARRAALNMGEYLVATQAYMSLALKAQAQCRATLEALVALKKRQSSRFLEANVAHAPQRLNDSDGRYGKAETPNLAPNKLLETDFGQRLDSGAAIAAIPRDQAMVPVEASDGAENPKWKSPV